MDGGIRAWTGLTAEGPPEAGIAYFSAGTRPADMAALAWALEESTRTFYSVLAGRDPNDTMAAVFSSLVQAEEHHKETLASLHGRLTTEPVSRMYDPQGHGILEGGMELEAALRWSEGKRVNEILDLALGLEANAYDRYLKMLVVSDSKDAKEVFHAIAKEEKNHLRKLSKLLDDGGTEG